MIEKLYVAGGCRPNPGPGAAILVVEYTDHKVQEWDALYWRRSTSNHMMLLAVNVALRLIIEEPYRLRNKPTIYCESSFIQRGLTEWCPLWESNGWKNSEGKDPCHALLWQILYAGYKNIDVEWVWDKSDSAGAHLAWSLSAKVTSQGRVYNYPATA